MSLCNSDLPEQIFIFVLLLGRLNFLVLSIGQEANLFKNYLRLVNWHLLLSQTLLQMPLDVFYQRQILNRLGRDRCWLNFFHKSCGGSHHLPCTASALLLYEIWLNFNWGSGCMHDSSWSFSAILADDILGCMTFCEQVWKEVLLAYVGEFCKEVAQ